MTELGNEWEQIGTNGKGWEILSENNVLYLYCDEMQSHNQADSFVFFHTADQEYDFVY